VNNEEYYFTPEDDMIDISSSSTPKNIKTKKSKAEKSKKENVVSAYGNALFKNLGTIIKVISFIIAISLILVVLAVAFLLLKVFDSFFTPIAIGIVILGTIIAAFTFFIIYGIGHVICQNDEILRRFR
jgi:predicted RND superfamily exporter protein